MIYEVVANKVIPVLKAGGRGGAWHLLGGSCASAASEHVTTSHRSR
jgi:hypothetical protein